MKETNGESEEGDICQLLRTYCAVGIQSLELELVMTEANNTGKVVM